MKVCILFLMFTISFSSMAADIYQVKNEKNKVIAMFSSKAKHQKVKLNLSKPELTNNQKNL